MNKFRLFLSQMVILGVYFIPLVALGIVLLLQKQSFHLLWVVLRLTWIPIGLIIVYRIFREISTVKKIKQQQPVQRNDLVSQTYQSALAQQESRAQQAEMKAVQNERNLIDYLITWSHEMKLPIASLSLLAEQQDELNSDQVFKQVSLMKNQLDNLLTYERLNDFNHDLDFGWISLDNVIKATIQDYSTFFIEKQLQPKLEIGNVKILTDEKWLQFIIKQIIYNAIKYADDGTAIQVSFCHRQLTITDTGLPISASELPRIFEPGFTGSNGRTKQSATGMGLYLVKRICDELNIKIEVRSKGKTTKVMLTFPNSALPK
ncbi:sensor histidine kinase [Fructilactobacillus sp. Tb1]|uniref:sensor histidine kinase n=1 Tax=Fructilactobacillus sp. Tb1 TaxID=3422304 RepID=UPI003D2DC344